MDKTIVGRKLPSKKERHQLFGSVTPGPRSKPTTKDEMPDLQNVTKDFLFDLDAVGISNVKHPIIVNSSIQPETQTTIGEFTFSSSIHRMSKGTNMSRFTEQLQKYHESGFSVSIESLKAFAVELTERLKQKDATVEVTFPWFYSRKGPESNLAGLNHADVTLKVTYEIDKGFDINGSLSVLITTLCP